MDRNSPESLYNGEFMISANIDRTLVSVNQAVTDIRSLVLWIKENIGNKISDDPILSLVLTAADGFDFAEERRLFYVAITRTKNVTYLIADRPPLIGQCDQ